MWVFETVTLSVITLLLFFLMLSCKAGRIKLLLGFLTFLSSIASMVLFFLMQKASGNPDRGMELFQLYLPCAAYSVLALFSFIAALLSRRTPQKEKVAKKPPNANSRKELDIFHALL